MGDAVYETIAYGIRRDLEEDWNVARSGLQRFRLGTANGDQNIGP